jgi:hypothetical protein
MPTNVISSTLIPTVLAIFLFAVALLVSLRALYIFNQTRSPRLFILGLSLGVIALTALADLISSNLTSITLNTDWFLYIGQAVSFLFILLSLISSNDAYLNRLMRVHVLVSVVLIGLLVLSPTLPPFSNVAIKAILSGSRSVICFGIFFSYISAFMNKQTRFSLLMSIAFMLVAFGYLMIAQQYFVSDSGLFDNIGDLTRMLGLCVLLLAVFGG